MGGYYKLGKYDARQLSMMVGQLSTERSRVARAHMTLFLWSQMQSNGKPCPFFRTGIKSLSTECDVTQKAARAFLGRAEEYGWLVRVGEERNKMGRFTKRTFRWVAEEAADAADMDLDEWLMKVGGMPQKGHMGMPQKGHMRGVKSQQIRAYGYAPDPCKTAGKSGGSGTLQSTEYSEEGVPRHSSGVVARPPIVTDEGYEIVPCPWGDG